MITANLQNVGVMGFSHAGLPYFAEPPDPKGVADFGVNAALVGNGNTIASGLALAEARDADPHHLSREKLGSARHSTKNIAALLTTSDQSAQGIFNLDRSKPLHGFHRGRP